MLKKIEVYGMGCSSCQKLYELARQAVQELGADIRVEKVEDLQRIMTAGVMRTPGLAFDGILVLQGKIPTLPTLRDWIEKAMQAE